VTSDFGPLVTLDDPAFIHPTALIYGKATFRAGSSLWANAVVRAEAFEIEVGEHTNIQDFVMIHVGARNGTKIGAHCTVAHHCTIHGAEIGDNCLIGINATLMDESVIGANSIVAGGAFVPHRMVVPENAIVMGVPAKVTGSQNNWARNRFNAAIYHLNALAYAKGEHRAWDGDDYAVFAKETRARLEAEFKVLFERDSDVGWGAKVE
jgi:carbonic anhydrase/acetyltransferase-like protein (isoleucine patch superfamily)